MSRVIKEDTSIDDVLIGEDDKKILLDICEKSFRLRKWLFNMDISSHDLFKRLLLGDDVQNRTLGLKRRTTFHYVNSKK